MEPIKPVSGPQGAPKLPLFDKGGKLPQDLIQAKTDYEQVVKAGASLDRIQEAAQTLAKKILELRERLEQAFAGDPAQLTPLFDGLADSNANIQSLNLSQSDLLTITSSITEHTKSVRQLFTTVSPSEFPPIDTQPPPPDTTTGSMP